MYKDDDRLEDALRGSQEGQNSQRVGATGPESEDVSSLVRLAASIWDLPHPEQGQAAARVEKRRIMAAANRKSQKQRTFGWSRNGGFTGQWMVLPAVAGAALLVLMAFVLATGAGLYFSGPLGAHAASLESSSGMVEILDADGGGGWREVSDGYRVKTGQRVRTGADSQVTLAFYDGTQVTLDPNTDLMLSKIAGDWGKQLQVAMIQNEGETSHRVVPLQGADSEYSVMTPSGEAYVRGTSFKVLVEETGNSVFSVDSGAVLVSNNGEEALLAAGQGVVTELGQPLAAPSFLFSLQGELQQKKLGKTWVVEGVNITLRGYTRIDGNPQENGMVLVTGRISKKGEWIADSIIALDSQDKFGTFTGVVTGVSEGGVEIDGYPFEIQDKQPEVSVGDLVRVQFLITDQYWLVLTLQVLSGSEAGDPDPDPEPEPEPAPELEANVYFVLEEDGDPTCQAIGPVSITLKYETVDQEAPALQVSLVVAVEQNGDYIVEPVTISPIPGTLFSIERNTEVPIIITMQLQAGVTELPPGGEVKIKISVWDELAEEFIGDSYELKWECDEELPEEEDPDDDDGDKCTRDKQHPHALTLADVYGEAVGVDYDQIWSWFCEDNLGFGEIEQAFKLYLEYGEVLGDDFTVYEIIEMRLIGGLGWGQIKQAIKHDAQDALELLGEEETGKKVPPGKEKSEEAKNKDKPNKKDK